MQKVVQFFVGLWLIWLPIATVLYFLNDDSFGEIKEIEIGEMMHMAGYVINDADIIEYSLRSSSAGEDARTKAVDASISKLGTIGIDVSVSAYEVISEAKGVTKLNLLVARQFKGDDETGQIVFLDFDADDAAYRIEFFATDKTFTNPFGASVMGFGNMEITTKNKRFSIDHNELIGFLINLASNEFPSVASALPPRIRREIE